MSFDTGGVPPERTGSTPHPAADAADLDPLAPAEEAADRAAGDAAEAHAADADASAPAEPVATAPAGGGDADGTQTTQLQNGLTCAIPRSSPLAALLRSERTWTGPSAKERQAILRRAKSVAIVGASPNPARSSYFVGTYLQQSSDYRVYFVNPNATEILGQEAYPDLASLPEVPDIVDVFRKASDIPSVVDDSSRSARPSSGCSSASGTRTRRSTPRPAASRSSWTGASRSSTRASTAACTCSASTPA